MQQDQWIGLQFNLDQQRNLKPWLADFALMGVTTDGEHITSYFDPAELADWRGVGSVKVELLKTAFRKCLKHSELTLLYTYIDASDLAQEKTSLMEGELFTPHEIPGPNPDLSIFENLSSCVESPAVLSLLDKNPVLDVLNELFAFVANRKFAPEQQLTLSLAYEGCEPWEAETDYLFVAVELTE